MTHQLAASLAAMFGLTDVCPVGGGHQAQVFTACGVSGPLIVKVIDAALADPAQAVGRVTMAAALAAIEPDVCRPLPLAGRLVHEVRLADGGLGLATLWQLAGGRAPDPADGADVARMGAALARLHTAMATLGPSGLPPVAAYRNELDSPSWQVLHGDFNTANLRIDGDIVRVFDFDDCGRGPIEFDVANAIYMVLFDSYLAATPSIGQQFRTALLDGYAQQSGTTFPADVIDREIVRRVNALAGWLNVPEAAPVGIRTSTDEWKQVLRAFVDDHRG
ncbi:MAG: phosphotransferase [Actinomycetota bacterium]|nr:phosphotransferase [Actinomycetota bacterium]